MAEKQNRYNTQKLTVGSVINISLYICHHESDQIIGPDQITFVMLPKCKVCIPCIKPFSFSMRVTCNKASMRVQSKLWSNTQITGNLFLRKQVNVPGMKDMEFKTVTWSPFNKCTSLSIYLNKLHNVAQARAFDFWIPFNSAWNFKWAPSGNWADLTPTFS